MEKEIFTRYLTYLLSFQTYQIVSVLRNKYGKDKVDSTVYYDNFKSYIAKILLNTKAVLFLGYINDNVIRDSPNAIQRFYSECPPIEICQHDIDTLKMTYDDAPLIDFLMDYRKEVKEGFYTLITYFCHYLKWLYNYNCSEYSYFSELEIGLGGEGCNRYISPMTYVMYDKINIVQNENEDIQTTVYDYIVVVPTMLGMIGAKDFTTYSNQTGILGTKMSFTKDQLKSGYIHSHREVGFGYGLRPTAHCTGGENPINDVVNIIRIRQRKHPWQAISRMEVLNFAENLYIYLGVESIQGGPWIKIQNMSGGRNLILSETTQWNDVYNLTSVRNSSWKEKMKAIANNMFMINKSKHFVKFSISTTGISFAQCTKDLAISFTNLLYIVLKNTTTYPSFRDLTFEASIKEQIYEVSNGDSSYEEEIKDCYFTMCGNTYTYKMIDDDDNENYCARIVKLDTFMYLLQYFKNYFYYLIKN